MTGVWIFIFIQVLHPYWPETPRTLRLDWSFALMGNRVASLSPYPGRTGLNFAWNLPTPLKLFRTFGSLRWMPAEGFWGASFGVVTRPKADPLVDEMVASLVESTTDQPDTIFQTNAIFTYAFFLGFPQIYWGRRPSVEHALRFQTGVQLNFSNFRSFHVDIQKLIQKLTFSLGFGWASRTRFTSGWLGPEAKKGIEFTGGLSLHLKFLTFSYTLRGPHLHTQQSVKNLLLHWSFPLRHDLSLDVRLPRIFSKSFMPILHFRWGYMDPHKENSFLEIGFSLDHQLVKPLPPSMDTGQTQTYPILVRNGAGWPFIPPLQILLKQPDGSVHDSLVIPVVHSPDTLLEWKVPKRQLPKTNTKVSFEVSTRGIFRNIRLYQVQMVDRPSEVDTLKIIVTPRW